MPFENFTLDVETDPANDFTVTATKVDITTLASNVASYVYRDHGVDYFNAIDNDFEIFIASTGANNGAVCATPAYANNIVTADAFNVNEIGVYLNSEGSPTNGRVFLMRGAFTEYQGYSVSYDTLYYCTLTRTAGSGTFSLKIYSNAARTTLLTTLTITGVAAATKYRYRFAADNYQQNIGTVNLSGYIQNLDLKAIGNPKIATIGRRFRKALND